jgi:WD40 repeat protein
MTPQTIGRYEIKEQLGRGGMSTVYLAYDPRFKRQVAIKILPRELLLDDPQFRARFEREAETIAALEHPAIVPVYDFGEEDGQPYLVMRLMTGGSLSERIAEGPLPAPEVARILKRIGSALDRAHEGGVIHRDLKPGNILFDRYGEAFLADFGIARLSQGSGTLTGTGGMVGTPAYMSPEQIRGSQLDGRTDVYALGIIVFEMLTGKKPYDADTPAMMLVKQITEPMPRVLEVNPDLPPGLEYVITRATAKEAVDRFDKAGELAETLASAVSGTTFEMPPTISGAPPVAAMAVAAAAVTPPPEPLPAPSFFRRAPVWVWALAGAAILLLCGCGLLAAARAGSLQREGTARQTVTASIASATQTVSYAIVQSEATTETSAEAIIPAEATAAISEAVPTTETATMTETAPVTETAVSNPITPDNITQMAALQQLGRGTVYAAVLSPDGQRLALGSSLGTWIYDAHTLEPLQLLQGHDNRVSAVAWAPDGRQLASASWDGTIRLWDVATGEQLGMISTDGQLLSLAWSPDGTTLASTTWGSPIELWDPTTGQNVGELAGNEGSISRLAWSPDGTRLVASDETSEMATLRLWDMTAGVADTAAATAVLPLGIDGGIANFTWSADSSRFISSGYQDGTARVWGADGSEQLVLTAHEYGTYDAAWSPDGTQILTVGGDNDVRAWDATTGLQIDETTDLMSTAVRLIWLADTNQIIVFLADGTILQVDAATETIINQLREHTAAISDVTWSPDGSQLATANSDASVRLWDAGTGEQLAILEGHSYGVNAVSWSPDGTLLASGGGEGAVRLWDVAQQQQISEWYPTENGPSALAWDPSGSWLAIGDWGGHIWLWDAVNETLLTDWQAHDDSVTRVAWSPDGAELATSGRDALARIWEPTTGTMLGELTGHTDIVEAVAWSPDGSQLATGSHDRTLRIWDRASGEELWEQSHNDLVMSVAWSAAGYPVASAKYDGTVHLWDPATGVELHQLYDNVWTVYALAWSPDGARLASGGDDGTVVVWGVSGE